MKSIKLAAATGLAIASISANAGLLTVSGGSDLVIPSNNDFFHDGLTTYNVGGDVYFDSNAPLNLTFTFLGKEAGWTNEFTAYGNNLLSTDAVNSSFTVNDVDSTANGGLVDFRFEIAAGGPNVGNGISNGGNMPWASEQSFAIMLDYMYGGIMYDAILLWDDSGADEDDNHDDHIIGIQASIPEPGSLALLGLGLAGLGLARRKSA